MKHQNSSITWRNVRYCLKECFALSGFFVFWVLITASFSARNIVLGLVFSVVVALMVRLVFRIRLPEDITPRFVFVRFPIFLLVLIWDVIKANINLAYLLLRPRLLIDPRIVSFKSALRGDFRNTILADTITVTPGTLTVDAHDDELLVHCLAPSHRTGLLEDRHSERMVLWLFKQRGEAGKGAAS